MMSHTSHRHFKGSFIMVCFYSALFVAAISYLSGCERQGETDRAPSIPSVEQRQPPLTEGAGSQGVSETSLITSNDSSEHNDSPVVGDADTLESFDRLDGDARRAVAKKAPEGPNRYPIRWTRYVELGSLKALAHELKRTHPKRIGVVHKWGVPGSEEDIRSCKRAIELHSLGYEEPVPFTFKGDAYIARCRPLQLLQKASASRVSHVHGFNVTRLDFDVLPPGLGTAFSRSRHEKQIELEKRGGTWRDFVPSARMEKDPRLKAHAARVYEDFNNLYLEHLAWADFDGDGYEDVLLYVVNSSTEGTAMYERLVAITRRDASARYDIVFEEEARAN